MIKHKNVKTFIIILCKRLYIYIHTMGNEIIVSIKPVNSIRIIQRIYYSTVIHNIINLN